MKKHMHIIIILFLTMVIASCAPLQENYGTTKMVPRSREKVTLQNLIDKWDDYNIYYAGYGPRLPLGIWFNPKDSDTRLVGDLWKPVPDKKTLIEITRWIYPYTEYEPHLHEIFGPKGSFYGYLYYSYGPVVFKKIAKNKMYVFDLEIPHEHDGGDETND